MRPSQIDTTARRTSRRDIRRSARDASRRSTRRTAVVATGVALGLLATAGVSAATPTSEAEAAGLTPNFVLASFTMSAEEGSLAGREQLASAADLAAADAGDAIASADEVAAAVKKAGLDVKGSTSVDTDDLEDAVSKLSTAFLLSAEDVEEVTTLVSTVSDETDDLSERLDKAKKAEAARIAAEKKRKAEEAAAKAAAAKAAAEAAARAASNSAPSSSYSSAPVASTGDNSPGGAQATARSMMQSRYGWGSDQFSCLVSLWNKESGWNYQAYNASSGAFGIPQALPGSKMATAGADWQTSAATQVSWGLGYIAGRYGTPCGAWSHSQSYGWY